MLLMQTLQFYCLRFTGYHSTVCSHQNHFNIVITLSIENKQLKKVRNYERISDFIDYLL